MATAPTNASGIPTVQDIQNTVALDSDPILRNLKITQGYHDLSEGMTGGGHLSWCGFASWSSKTIGQFLRDGTLRARGWQSIHQTPGYDGAISRIARILPALAPHGNDPFDNLSTAPWTTRSLTSCREMSRCTAKSAYY